MAVTSQRTPRAAPSFVTLLLVLTVRPTFKHRFKNVTHAIYKAAYGKKLTNSGMNFKSGSLLLRLTLAVDTCVIIK